MKSPSKYKKQQTHLNQCPREPSSCPNTKKLLASKEEKNTPGICRRGGGIRVAERTKKCPTHVKPRARSSSTCPAAAKTVTCRPSPSCPTAKKYLPSSKLRKIHQAFVDESKIEEPAAIKNAAIPIKPAARWASPCPAEVKIATSPKNRVRKIHQAFVGLGRFRGGWGKQNEPSTAKTVTCRPSPCPD